MAKKILAVVLAVMMAVSAMAVTAFADQRIDLYKATTTNKKTVTMTLDIPVYGMYGYLTAGDYMMVYLPQNLGGNSSPYTDIKWSVVINGVSYALESTKNAPGWGTTPVTEHKITLGYFGHNFDGKDTAIPQSIGYNTINSIRIVGETSSYTASWQTADLNGLLPNNDGGSYYNAPAENKVRAQWYKADGTKVEGSVSYGESWNPQVSDTSNSTPNSYDFVTNEWTSAVGATDEHVPLTWDHTLGNRAIIYAATEAELVVELAKPIVGQATYTLYANTLDGDALYDRDNVLWWNIKNDRQYVDTYKVDGVANELRFKVSPQFLYESDRYGTYNRQFVIFENITLLNNTVMANYLNVNRSLVGGAGSLGRLSWGESYEGDRIKLDGQPVNYARTGMAGEGITTEIVDVSTYESEVVTVQHGHVSTVNMKLDTDKLYKITLLSNTDAKNGTSGTRIAFVKDGDWWGNDALAGVGNEVTGAKIAEITGIAAGDPLVVLQNNNGAGQGESTLLIEAYKKTTGLNGQNLGADVTASAIYLNFPEPEATEPAPDETVTTPTEETDQAADDEQVDVGDVEEPAETTPAPAEQNPPTGLVLAVVPMLVAAAAAVVAKKH